MAKNPREPLREAINKNRDGKNHSAPQVRATPSSGETPESSAVISGYKPSGPGDHKEAGSDGERSENSDPYAKRAVEAAETQSEYARWQAWGGVAGAIVGGLAAIFTGWAAWAAASAAKSAAASNEIARDTAKRELRAYLDVSSAEVRNLEGVAEYVIEFTNTGQTPAYKVQGWITLEMQPHNFNKVGEFSFFGDVPVGSKIFITKIAPRQLSPDEMIRVQIGMLEINIFGELNYVDTFGENHCTTFRRMIGYEGWIGKYGKMGICHEGNVSN